MKLLLCLAALVLPLLAHELTPVLKELKNGNLEFSSNVYKELAKVNAGKNFLVCPLSVAVVLALTEAGAGGKTAQELITGLNLPDTEEKIHEAFKAVAPSLNVDGEYTLSSANKVYIMEGFKIKSHFKQVATDVFNAEVTEIDFSKNVDAADEVNKWVSEKTHDKIKNLINSGDLSADTRAVLVNALYFHGLWVHPFYVDNTEEKTFKVSNTQEVKVKMMEQTKSFNYFEDAELKVKYLEMAYANSPISMIFILPDEVEGLSAIEANIHKVLKRPNFSHERVHVQIPRVHVEHKIDFISVLEKLGVHDAFSSAANFTRLIETDEKLVISKIVQKTFIDVEEKGTTAAAATAVIFQKSSLEILGPVQKPKEFNADHPFIFVIKSPNGVVFLGRYVTPGN